jgi:hypothetical protein
MWQPGLFRAWNPAPVHWFNVGNQLGWAPAGTLNSHGLPPSSAIVVGTRQTGETHGLKITPGVRPPLSSELTEKITRASAPVVQRSEIQRSEFHAGAAPVIAPPSRPKNFPQDGAIRFDPATRTYMNSYPAPSPNPPASAENSLPADSSSGGGSVSPRRTVQVRPSNTVQQRPTYVAPPQHAAPTPHYYTPPVQPAPHSSSPPSSPPVHSSPPPTHTSSGGTSTGHH